MKYLHISAKVESRIESLGKSSKTGKALAQKARRIIESLASGTGGMDAIGNYTNYGENRIRNCRKFDLGCGYRMIMLQRGPKIFIPFLGTHDECQRWLENNSRLKEVADGSGTLFRICRGKKPPANRTSDDAVGSEVDAEDEFSLKISDKDLRRVFSGLIEGAKKRLQ